MSSKNRRPYETATVLDQDFLDFSQDNLEQRLHMIAKIERPQAEERRVTCTFTLAAPGIVNATDHRVIDNQGVIFETTGTLPTPLVAGVTYYGNNVSADTLRLSLTAGGAAISLGGSPTGIHQISFATGLLRISNANIYVGARFYVARTNFPPITRTLGEWLRPQIEFSAITLLVNNVDELYSGMLPAGDNFEGQVNKQIDIEMGIRNVESTYFPLFQGFVSETGGFKRDPDKIKYVARDKFDKLNVTFPITAFTITAYPKIGDSNLGKNKPIIYGDYTARVEAQGNVPGIVVNGADPEVYKEKTLPISITNGTPGVMTLEDNRFDDDDIIKFTTDGTLPTPLLVGTNYYVQTITANTFAVSATPGGASINTSGGSGQHNVIAQTLRNIQFVISETTNIQFDDGDIWVLRNDSFYLIAQADITNIHANLNSFEIIQDSGNTLIEGANYIYQNSDDFFLKVKGKTLGGYEDNGVWMARDILITYGQSDTSDFNADWATYRDKATPAQSNIAGIKLRAYVQKSKNVLDYSLSILEQLRLEMYTTRENLNLGLKALHFEDWAVSPTIRIRNFDVVDGSANISIDERNNFNRVKGFYDNDPVGDDNLRDTNIIRNQASIDQAKGKLISKQVEFPNLYIEDDVVYQLKEIIKIASGFIEIVILDATPRLVLLDLGDIVLCNFQLGSTKYEDIPMMVREIQYDQTLKLRFKLWSFQMMPYGNPGGWNPGYEGIVGGDTATITEE